MNSERVVKQVIVVRKDLNMRKGKMCAQAAHASLASVTKKMILSEGTGIINVNAAMKQWLNEGFTKIVVSVDSEEALLDLIARAELHNVPVFPITDSGRTEFNGVATLTCAAFGPDYVEKIDSITEHLPLI